MSERPEPAIRRARPHVTVDGDASLRVLGVTTINEREVECQRCWNRTVVLTVQFRKDWVTRGALVVVTLAALLCAWMAWDAHGDRAKLDLLRDQLLESK